MFFILSKILGFFALPSNLLIAIGMLGVVAAVHALPAAGELARRHEHCACSLSPAGRRSAML